MSTSSVHQASPAVLSAPRGAYEAPSRSAGLLALAADTVLGWIQRDRDRRALGALDDRLLRDIGVSRGEVEAEVTKPFWRG